jgi:hypothetical protein
MFPPDVRVPLFPHQNLALDKAISSVPCHSYNQILSLLFSIFCPIANTDPDMPSGFQCDLNWQMATQNLSLLFQGS